jgi:hypothetical protein
LEYGVSGQETIATIIRVHGGNFRLLVRLLRQIERILKISDFNYVTRFVVEAARGGFSHWFVEYGTGRAPQGGLAGGIHTRSKGNGLRSYSGLTLGMPSSAITALGVDVETASDL